jgi:ribosomal protein L27
MHYTELVLLHPVGYTGQKVHSGASVACNVNTLFFTLVRALCGFHKKRRDTLHRTCVFISGGICKSRSAFQCVRDTKRDSTIFHARMGLVRIRQKAHQDTLRRSCVSTSGGIYGSRRAFQGVQGMKC